jgi:hypothetical protein
MHDDPSTPPPADDDEPADPAFEPVRDPRTGEVDHYASLVQILRRMIDREPVSYWEARPWQLRALGDLRSAATGERCTARFEVVHDGAPLALLEFRPGQTSSPLGETYGLRDMWYVHRGRRKPRMYVHSDWALAYAMGLPRRDMWDSRYRQEWSEHGDIRAQLALLVLEEGRNRAVDRAYQEHLRRPRG